MVARGVIEHALDIADGENRAGLGRERLARPVVHALGESIEQGHRIIDDRGIVLRRAVKEPTRELELPVEQRALQ
jgi:hypothetical protein